MTGWLVVKRFLFRGSAVLALPGLTVLAASQQRIPPQELFVIERSKNANIVKYDLQLQKNGFYDVRKPLDVYWLMRAEDGRREELSALEREVVYGYEFLPNPKATELGFRLIAVKERPLAVRKRGNAYRAELPIGGVPASLERIYVATKEGAILPTVLYVELRGKSVADGRPVRERLTK